MPLLSEDQVFESFKAINNFITMLNLNSMADIDYKQKFNANCADIKIINLEFMVEMHFDTNYLDSN